MQSFMLFKNFQLHHYRVFIMFTIGNLIQLVIGMSDVLL